LQICEAGRERAPGKSKESGDSGRRQ
jgi:hypothetical protein